MGGCIQLRLKVPVLVVLTAFLASAGSSCLAQDMMLNPQESLLEDNAPQEVSREEWRARVAEAKRRAQQLAIEQRGRMLYRAPSREEEESAASERVRNDDSLQSGDIVSTNKGLFVFRGRQDRERTDSDFVALPPR